MSYFRIIQLLIEPADKDADPVSDVDLVDDPLMKRRSDWLENQVAEKDMRDVLVEVADELKDIATVNPDARTVTFLCRETVAERYAAYLEKKTAGHLARVREGKVAVNWHEYDRAVEDALGIDDLFWKDSFCYCASRLIGDYLDGWLPQTLHVAVIWIAHC